MTDRTPSPPAGWYPAAHANGELRYWDGSRWAEVPPPPPAPGAQAGEKTRGGRIGTLVTVVGLLVAIAGAVLAWLTWFNPNPSEQLSSKQERQQYIAQVDSLCADYFTAVQDIGLVQDYGSAGGTDPSILLQALSANVELLRELSAAWREVPPPDDNDMTIVGPAQDALESMIASNSELVTHLQRGLSGADFEDDLRDEMGRLETHAEEFRSLTREYGLQVCPQIVS